MAATGGLTHVAYGLWRFDDQPRTGRDQFMEAVLRVGADSYLTHDAVLAFHELAQVNPRRIRVGTPHRARARVPDFVEVVRQQIDPVGLTVYEGVPSAWCGRCSCRWRRLIDQSGQVLWLGRCGFSEPLAHDLETSLVDNDR